MLRPESDSPCCGIQHGLHGLYRSHGEAVFKTLGSVKEWHFGSGEREDIMCSEFRS